MSLVILATDSDIVGRRKRPTADVSLLNSGYIWVKTKTKQFHWNKTLFCVVLFQFCFSFISVITTALAGNRHPYDTQTRRHEGRQKLRQSNDEQLRSSHTHSRHYCDTRSSCDTDTADGGFTGYAHPTFYALLSLVILNNWMTATAVMMSSFMIGWCDIPVTSQTPSWSEILLLFLSAEKQTSRLV